MKLIFLGPPGAGKGTLATLVGQLYKIPHISTGEIFRNAIKEHTPLGEKIQALIDDGQLVGDDITIELVRNRLAQEDAEDGFILDGFPRTIAQAEALSDIVDINAAVNFDIKNGELIKRLSGRQVCKNCSKNFHINYMKPLVPGICDACGGELYTRDDDKIDSIKKRLEIYRVQTEPLIAHYQILAKLVTIDARPSVDKVLENFKEKFPL